MAKVVDVKTSKPVVQKATLEFEAYELGDLLYYVEQGIRRASGAYSDPKSNKYYKVISQAIEGKADNILLKANDF